MKNIFENFSHHSKSVMRSALDIMRKFENEELRPSHILYGLFHETGSLASEILKQSRLTSEAVTKALNEASKNSLPKNSHTLSPSTQLLLEKAASTASMHNHQYIGTEHLLLGLLETKDNFISSFFEKNRVNIFSIKEKILIVLKSTSKFPDLADAVNASSEKGDDLFSFDQKNKKEKKSLQYYGSNLTDAEVQSTIDPVIGRQDEIDRLVQILCRRTKNNPLLLGDPGVGKTAIVEGLAKKIMAGDVPEVLLNKKIFTLDLGLIIAGSSFRGEFENRIKNIIAEIKEDPNIILFIDEIHNIIGAGSATGSMDAANILKPSLARGEIRCVGATTMEEYKKYIENDLALERRFQPIFVNQPSIEKTVEILKGIKGNYEKYHRVKITDNAIEAACKLSSRYIQDKFLPDKAIDLIDEAASAYKINNHKDTKIKKIKTLENEMRAIQMLKQKAVFSENFDLALQFREKEETLNTLHTKLKNQQDNEKKITVGQIDDSHIMTVISKIARVPLQDLVTSEKNTLLQLEKKLSQHIIGQDHALKAVSECIRRSKAGISNTNRPIGSFIFLGPSGVGKTELAKVLSENVFGGSDFLIRIDMSEFAASFDVSKLIGSPAGYVGYKDQTKLTDMVFKKPYSVILFDEIEKAHPQIFNIMLQILDDGQLSDSSGKIINFKNTIIIMTSNIGSEEFNKLNILGFHPNEESSVKVSLDSADKSIKKNLGQFFKNEFLNRIDKVITFNTLDTASLKKIAVIQLKELQKRLREKNIIIDFDPRVTSHLARVSSSHNQGARLIRKNILELIENEIAKYILAKKNSEETPSLRVGIQNNKIVVE